MTTAQTPTFDIRKCWEWTDIFRAVFQTVTSDTERALIASGLRSALESHEVLLTREVYGPHCDDCGDPTALAAYRSNNTEPLYLCGVCATLKMPSNTVRVEVKAP